MKKTTEARTFVVSTGCTTIFPDLDLTLQAGEVTQIPAAWLELVLVEPSVSQAIPHEVE